MKQTDYDNHNKRKAKCGWCDRILEKGQGDFRLGHISKQPFYVCSDGKGCDKPKTKTIERSQS